MNRAKTISFQTTCLSWLRCRLPSNRRSLTRPSRRAGSLREPHPHHLPPPGVGGERQRDALHADGPYDEGAVDDLAHRRVDERVVAAEDGDRRGIGAEAADVAVVEDRDLRRLRYFDTWRLGRRN